MNTLENNDFDESRAREIFDHFAPHLLEEIQGLSDALGISFKRAASLLSGFAIPKVKGMGCSSVVNQKFIVCNYGFSPEIYDHRLVLIQPRECFASVGHSLHVLGRHEVVNEEGLSHAFHFVKSELRGSLVQSDTN